MLQVYNCILSETKYEQNHHHLLLNNINRMSRDKRYIRLLNPTRVAIDPLTFSDSTEPYNTIVKAFSSSENNGRERLHLLVPYLKRCAVPDTPGSSVFSRGLNVEFR